MDLESEVVELKQMMESQKKQIANLQKEVKKLWKNKAPYVHTWHPSD